MATSARLDELKKKFDESPRRYFAPLANEYRKLGDLTQAVALCRAHLPNQPGHVSGHIVLAQALYESRELGESRAAFEQALDLDPENLIALRYLGDIAREQDAPDVARAWYERVLDADPRNDEIAALLTSLTSARATHVDEAHADLEATPANADTEYSHESHASSAANSWDESTVESNADISLAHHTTPPPPALILDDVAPLSPSSQAEDVSEHAFGTASTDEAFSAFTTAAPGDPLQFASEPHAAAEEPAGATSDDPFSEAFAEAEAARNDVISLSDLEAIAEPHEDDWFGQSESSYQAPEPSSASDRFPDFADVTPTSSRSIAPLEPSFAQAEEISAAKDALQPSLLLTASETTEEVLASAAEESAEAMDEIAAPFAADETSSEEPNESVVESQREEFEESFDFSTRPTPPMPMASISPWAITPVADATPVVSEQSVEDSATDPYAAGAPELSGHELPAWDDKFVLTSASAREDADEAPEQAPESIAASVRDEPALSVSEADAVEVDARDADVAAVELSADAEAAIAEAPRAESLSSESPVAESQLTSDLYFADVVDEHTSDDLVTESVSASEQSAEHESSDDERFENDPVYGRTPAFGNEAVEPTPDAFVTETMAELYLQQGFTDDALSIYQQLLERNPSDETLRARVDSLMRGEDAPPAPQVERSGQSARAFFAQFARRSSRRRTSSDEQESADADPAASAVASAVEPSSTFSGVATTEEALTVPDDRHASDPSTLESLFGENTQSNADEAAAGTLAAAFSPEAVTTESRSAETQELSLQHLFGDVPASSPSDVSLDDFFATSRDERAMPNEAGPTGGERADIEQFTAWLEGLKKK